MVGRVAGHTEIEARRRRIAARRRAVVTGIGATTPLGADAPTTWRAALAGHRAVRTLVDDWAQQLPVRLAATLRAEPDEVLDPVQMRRMNRSQQVAVVAAREAWRDAGSPEVAPERLAVVIGTGIGGALTMLRQHRVLLERGPSRMSPFAVPMLMPNGAASSVSLDLGARGGAHAPMSACASGAEAIAAGLALIRSGRADVVVAGGVDACLGPLSMAGFARMGALSRRHDQPQAALRPFDRDRDGFVMAEGGGVVVLEREEFARARDVRRYAVLAGAGITSDAHDVTAPHLEGQVRAIEMALETADLTPAEVTHVNAHATGTPLGDTVEARAIGKAIGSHPKVTAVKSMTGHMIGGSGAVEAIMTVLSIHDSVIPGTRNVFEQDPEVDLDLVKDTPYHIPVAAATTNSFGFGGHNAVLAFTTG